VKSKNQENRTGNVYPALDTWDNGFEAYVVEISEFIEERRRLTADDFGAVLGEREMFTPTEQIYKINLTCNLKEVFGKDISSVEVAVDIHDFIIDDAIVCNGYREGWFYRMSGSEAKLVLEHILASEIFRLTNLLEIIKTGRIEPLES